VPLAVGRMAIPSDQLSGSGTEKGKAVLVTHVWKDFLWDMGTKPVGEPEEKELNAAPVQTAEEAEGEEELTQAEPEDGANTGVATPPPPSELDAEELSPTSNISYTPDEVSELLQKALLQSISTILASAPPSTFPIPATLFYTNYILPCRPAFPTLVLKPSAAGSIDAEEEKLHIDPQELTIKTSTHKSLTAFLKAAEKQSLITLKQPQKHSQQSDSLVMAVNAKNPLVIGHKSFATVRDVESTAARKKARLEEKAKLAEGGSGLEIKELWKPHLVTVELFKGIGARYAIVCTIRSILAHHLRQPFESLYSSRSSLPSLRIRGRPGSGEQRR